VCVENVNLCQIGGVGQVEVSQTDGLGRLIVEVGYLIDVEAELAGFGRVEGVEAVGVVLGGVKCRADTAVEC
jgi:hypothetical protein